MAVAAGGGGAVQGEHSPMQSLADQLNKQAQAWAATFAPALTTCGNPTLDGAISGVGGAFKASAEQLSGASTTTAGFVCTTSGNFSQADGG
ncbi:MAG: hypothetical protein M3Y36_01935 [Actinomycetota bacterium]|nr:hypothetical protein [Actinomycetota bacterium]